MRNDLCCLGETEHVKNTCLLFKQMMDVFSKEARPRFFMAVFLLAMQQLCGIDGVLYVRSSS